MRYEKVKLSSCDAKGYVIPLGTINLVFVVTENGMIGCGAFDVVALDAFDYPAARVRSTTGKPITTIEDLLDGIVKEANKNAMQKGVTVGMTGREALELLSRLTSHRSA